MKQQPRKTGPVVCATVSENFTIDFIGNQEQTNNKINAPQDHLILRPKQSFNRVLLKYLAFVSAVTMFT